MAASNPNQMEAAQAQVQEVVGVMRNNIDKVVLIVVLIIVVLIMRNNIDRVLFVVRLWCFLGMIIHHCEFHTFGRLSLPQLMMILIKGA